MKISPQYSVRDYLIARESEDIGMLLAIFDDRLNGRYLKPINLILNGPSDISSFAGFSTLALDCILIETLVQFQNGYNETPFKKGEQTFIDFLTKRESFKHQFTNAIAKTFYDDFRNGLLHQAQTKRKSLIKINQMEIVSFSEDGLIIDRNKFHDAILEEIKIYKKQILENENPEVRQNFIKKMNFICCV